MMSALQINTHDMSTIEVTCRESDKYTQDVFLKFERVYQDGGISGLNEMSISPTQLELLGKYLLRQAEEIRQAQIYKSK
jgi:hypothetical protein